MYTSKRIGKTSAAVFATALFLMSSVDATEWKDPSKHIVRFIEVQPGVKLEVLDWGGHGQAVLMLAGVVRKK